MRVWRGWRLLPRPIWRGLTAGIQRGVHKNVASRGVRVALAPRKNGGGPSRDESRSSCAQRADQQSFRAGDAALQDDEDDGGRQADHDASDGVGRCRPRRKSQSEGWRDQAGETTPPPRRWRPSGSIASRQVRAGAERDDRERQGARAREPLAGQRHIAAIGAARVRPPRARGGMDAGAAKRQGGEQQGAGLQTARHRPRRRVATRQGR